MTKEEFEQLHDHCVKGWRFLERIGCFDKPDYFMHYERMCPACEIAELTAKLFTMRRLRDVASCDFCPITVWRKQRYAVTEGIDVLSDDYYVIVRRPECQRYAHSLYSQWVYAASSQTPVIARKIAAGMIASLEWEFLPQYESVDVSALIDYLK